jgi:predicted nucleotidyltransferase
LLDLPLDKIQKFCKQEGIAYMAIFGSYAKGEAGPDSDIDILVAFVNEKDMDLLHFFNIKNRLSDLLGRRVDFVAKSALHPRVRADISRTLKEVFPHAA